MKRILAFLSLCFLAAPSILLTAQSPVEKAVQYRFMADSLIKSRQYAQAIQALDYYLEHAPQDDRYTNTYGDYRKKRNTAISNLQTQLRNIYRDAHSALKHGDQQSAYALFNEYLQNCITPDLRKDHSYTVALTHRGLQLQSQGKIREALDIFDKVVQLRLHGEHMDFVHSAETYNLIAAAHNQLGEYNQAIENGEKAVEIYRKRYGKNHEHYATSLSNLASYYTSRNAPGDRQHAVELGEEALRCIPDDNPAFAHAKLNLVVFYSNSGDKVKAQRYSKIALKKMKKMEKNSVNYATMLSNMAIRLANASNFTQAAEYGHEAIGIFEENGETQSLNFARLLSNTASFEKHAENYPEAIKLWQRAAAIYEVIQTKNGSGYLDCMSEITGAYAKMGNLEQAADINEKLTVDAVQGSKDDAHYAHSLAKRASIMATDGNYQQAIALESKALEIFRYRKDMDDVAQSLSDISNYLYHSGKEKAAIDTCLAALKIYENVRAHEEDKALAYNNLSIYYFTEGRHSDALQAAQEAVKLFESTGRTNTSLFAKILTNQALYESSMNQYAEAIATSERADSIQRNLLGEQHPDQVILTFNRSYFHIKHGDTIEAQRLYHKAMRQQMYHVRSNFSHKSTRGRELYWGTKSYVFHNAPYVACLLNTNDSARIDAYNAMLFTKGLLLNSEVDFRNLLAHTASEELQDKYAELEAIHQEIEEIWRNPTDENRSQVEHLNYEANRLERELVRGCKEFGDFTAAMNIDVNDVVKALPADAAAIEFFDIEARGDGRTYWALIVRSGDTVPQLVRLFSELELNEITYDSHSLKEALSLRDYVNSVYDDPRVGKLVWEPLMPYLEGIHSVWFSPTGLFYQWGIEYLNYDDRRMTDLFAMHRVSSTKQLVGDDLTSNFAESDSSRKLSNVVKRAVIFGGLNYDATPAQLQAANMQLGKESLDYLKFYMTQMAEAQDEDLAMTEGLTRDAMTRDGLETVKFLKWTLTESKEISDILFMEDVDVDLYQEERGTEEAFKGLSGSNPTILHIATHGFTLTENEAQKNKADLDYLGMSGDQANQADNSLCYAGLLMAGANNTLRRLQMPADLENGILTAREIASMDLRGLELVVLSACQTGLGQLREDGVFGLQRGFKKAGAHTLLMSLWSVDDEATKAMMTAFYAELAKGASRRAAFHAAQNSLRANPRFESPIYWASFIMLDD